MTPEQILRRKRDLKRQAVEIIEAQIEEIEVYLGLYRAKRYFEAKIGKDPNPKLSQKIDLLNCLIEE